MENDCRSCKYYEKDVDVPWPICRLHKFHFEDDFSPCDDFESNGSSGGCYLTTACVIAKDLPDDCAELQTLRTFRDEYLNSTEGGRQDIEQYYRCAPKLVKTLDKLPDSKQVYDRIYAELVIPCVEFIKDRKYEEAYNLYHDYTVSLYQLYHVEEE